MEALTKEEAIKKHREMWNWIADETLKRKEYVNKLDYFKAHRYNIDRDDYPVNNCFCCHYAAETDLQYVNCKICPIDWPSNDVSYEFKCTGNLSPYRYWVNLIYSQYNRFEYTKAAELAREIANLPEREDVEDV